MWQPKTIHLIAAARPNFMKIAPLYHALSKEPWAEPIIVHTGQHYDLNMSDAFFKDLKLPDPHIHLGIGSGTHAEQTGRVMIAYEKELLKNQPDLTVVVGDVNSTVAATLAAVKLGVKVAHLEAGLRSFDRTMPEEINRIVTDSLADILWTPSVDGDENLKKEGIAKEKIERVGNIMIDSLEMLRPVIEKQDMCKKLNIKPKNFGLVTLHRPSNVDKSDVLKSITNSLVQISEKLHLVFPIHPRTRKNLQQTGFLKMLTDCSTITVTVPLTYIQFMSLLFNARLAITDSGGIQEETTYLGIPCLTLRPNTERPITINQGTNRLGKPDTFSIEVTNILNNGFLPHKIPELWDGATAGRITQSIDRYINQQDSPEIRTNGQT
ncbi:MAG TPA: UDP-N-acetylglucosamine 2-epimerase (non-hydrolyzing) [Desulfobacterales bacterium]|nr:UDP-N-acetylglucosamine 2-epimerase (non-hydrolyzing) [Desulfobacterales bacterium]